MKAYKVIYKTFSVKFEFVSLGGDRGWHPNEQEKFFGTKEAAEEFAERKNKAAQELGLFPSPLIANVQEVELE
jgi:hypothetical protein